MSEMKYIVPQSFREALALAQAYRDRAGIMAGGTDMLVRMKKGLELPEVVINIEGLREMNYIRYDIISGLHIGAVTPLVAIENSAVIRSKYAVLSQAAGLMASPTIRRKATIGGNLGNAAPSADIVPALIVLGAGVRIAGPEEEEKVVPVEEFFTGPGQTILEPGQIIVEIQAPEVSAHSAAVYWKQKRREGADLAIAGAAVMVTLEEDSCELPEPEASEGADRAIAEVKIALSAVAPTPIRARKAEEVLRGRKPDEALLREAGKAAAGECRPIDDVRGSAEYRRTLVEVLVARAVEEAIELILNKPGAGA